MILGSAFGIYVLRLRARGSHSEPSEVDAEGSGEDVFRSLNYQSLCVQGPGFRFQGLEFPFYD